MPLFGPGYTGPKEVKYLFIDGGCLRACLERVSKTYAAGHAVDIDYGALAGGYSKLFYYDALAGRKSGESEADYRARSGPQRQLFDHLSVLDRFHVYEGDVRRSTTRRASEQKKVDVMIAVDMLTHSFRRNMHEATLLTGDLDFKPLIDALVQEGMLVTLWYPPGETSKELIAAADRSRPLLISDIHGALPNPKAFDIPQSHAEPSKGEYLPVLLTTPVDGGDARLMKDGQTFVFEVPVRNNRNVVYYRHSDLAILRSYMLEMRGISLPIAPEEGDET